jgi:hypothetical protein
MRYAKQLNLRFDNYIGKLKGDLSEGLKVMGKKR